MEAKKISGEAKSDSVEQKKEKNEKVPTKKVLPYMQNRELSWLTFNKRVLDQGEDHNVPILERLTFVSIFSSNLQEFFMVRVGSLTDLSLLKKELRENKTLMTPDEQIMAIHNRCHELYPEQERIFKQIQEQLAEEGIKQLQIKDLDEEQEAYLRTYLHDKVSPFLSPQIINSRHPFPHLENGALYVLLRLDDEQQPKESSSKTKKKEKNVGANDATFGLIPLPRQAERIIKLPGKGLQFILLENALKLIVDEVFSMYVTKRASVICVTRNADIDANDGVDEIDYDYREHMKRILKKRARLAPVRLETDTPLSSVTEKFLLKRLNLEPHQVYVTQVPLDMGYAWALSSMIDEETAKRVTSKPFTPQWPACLEKGRSIIEQVCEHDVLLSYPYESMEPFVQLLKEAANDPSVLSIKITLYRLANQSHLAEALLAAAENGKEVTALFELRARFDESNNIEWSQRFEQAGANVIYGFHDFKVHSKICTITRHSEQGIQHITQLGTGNYNEKTSKLYTDFSFITTNEGIGKDAAEFFRNMSLENTSNNYQNLVVAPLQIKPLILKKIDEQIELAKQGKPNGVLFKTNSVTDKEIIDKIAESSQAGVHTTLFVRGISCIVPDVKGYTDNVDVVSIVGRLLEHSRIYGFGPHDDMEIYLASADLMTRNMDKRIEIAWQISEESLKKQVLDYLNISLSDTAKLRKLQNNLEFTPLEYYAEVNKAGFVESFDSQNYLIEKAQTDYENSVKQREEENKKRSAIAQAQRLRDAETLRHSATVSTHLQTLTQEQLIPSPKAEATSPKNTEPSVAENLENKTVAEAPKTTAPANTNETTNTPKEATGTAGASAQATTSTPVAQATTEAGAVASAPAPEATSLGSEANQDTAPLPNNQVSASAEAPSAQTAEAQKQTVTAEVLPSVEEPSSDAIQLVVRGKKPGFFKRLKFLFTGHF